MLINIELAPSVEEKLKNKANQKGKSLEELIVEMLEAYIEEEETKKELLEKINLGLGFSNEEWRTYHELCSLRDAQKLTEEQHEKLLIMSNEIKKRKTERMPYLLQLAEIEGIEASGTPEDIADYVAYRKTIEKSKATEEEIDALAKEVKSNYWNNIKERFRDKEGFGFIPVP